MGPLTDVPLQAASNMSEKEMSASKPSDEVPERNKQCQLLIRYTYDLYILYLSFFLS
jgi:hypothetical protein